jgi:carboxylesterase type B
MELSLQWVQNYIHLFGGNPSRVTISGESAGGGAVMLMSMLRGGQLGDSLFHQVGNESTFHSPLPYIYLRVIIGLGACLTANA